MPFFDPVSFLASLFNLVSIKASGALGPIEEDLTLSQYQKVEHLPHRWREVPSLPHPWHILTPSSSVENFWIFSLRFSNLSSDKGKTCEL